MELWDLYDANGRATGETVVRGEPIPAGRYHLVVHICIFNKDGQMLIQHRQPFKQGWPDRWDVSVGGSAVSGDSIQSAMEREVMEEIGYPIDLTGIPTAVTFTYTDCFDYYYIVEREIDLSKLQLQQAEVQAVKWATLEQIKAMIEDETFIPYPHCFMELLFQRRQFILPHTAAGPLELAK